jgi:hypothetical protein
MEHGCPAIRYRLATEVLPGILEPQALQALRVEVDEQPLVKQVSRKQKETGVWGGNLLGVSPNKATGVKDVGTIPQFRRLIELGLTKEARAPRMAARVLFRLVSRDVDPKLLFEYAKLGASELDAEPWIREILRAAATAALAHAGHGDDPRVRGAAHKILNQVSAFVRSELAESPFAKSGRAWVLHPQAYPPTIFSVSLLASLPAVQRERAGLVERLGQYLAMPAPKKTYTVPIGKKSIKPNFLLLGDPLHVSASGQPDDLPFALYWMELLARLGVLQTSASGGKVWGRLMRETGKDGVWRPKNLRTLPKTSSPWAYHMFPLESDTKSAEAKQTDVTFRMALIARIAGLELTAS